ncbi:TPA: ABC transporter permease, partial [Streptococcus agalactiae]|nr:ABC transporter permease [Streptococcus agalactiae]HEO7369943.1 ABC transporter permease [Streptococcus agalactiae]
MRIIAITEKVIKELFRDKRTLAMMFLAPILIMFLMNVMFSANSNTKVKIGTINVNTKVVSN